FFKRLYRLHTDQRTWNIHSKLLTRKHLIVAKSKSSPTFNLQPSIFQQLPSSTPPALTPTSVPHSPPPIDWVLPSPSRDSPSAHVDGIRPCRRPCDSILRLSFCASGPLPHPDQGEPSD